MDAGVDLTKNEHQMMFYSKSSNRISELKSPSFTDVYQTILYLSVINKVTQLLVFL